MKIDQVAAQLYTLRDYLKTPDDIAVTLKKVRQIGYQAVQLSGVGPIDDAELRRILQGEGLICCATHELGHQLFNETAAVIDRLNHFDCKFAAYPWPGDADFSSIAGVLDLAKKLDHAGAALAQDGKALAYHNHSIEFQRLDGRLILDVIFENTDPANLGCELDTYWVQHGGGDPTAWCRKLKGRLPLLHLKDYVITDNKVPTFAEVGFGNLDFKTIVAQAEKSGCQWFQVEQDYCLGHPLDSLKKSFDYIKENLCT